eukprot:s1357_g8.t1
MEDRHIEDDTDETLNKLLGYAQMPQLGSISALRVFYLKRSTDDQRRAVMPEKQRGRWNAPVSPSSPSNPSNHSSPKSPANPRHRVKVAHLGDEIENGDRRNGSKRTPRSKDSPGGVPLSPHRLAIDSALQCMQSRKSQLDVRNVARPSKWNLARLALAGPQSDEEGNLTEVQKLLRRVKGEYTTVTQKEDVLETIMNATAHASFECLGAAVQDAAVVVGWDEFFSSIQKHYVDLDMNSLGACK